MVDYLKDGFDWRRGEATLNELSHLRTNVEIGGFGDLDIHCEFCFVSRALYAID